MAWQAQAAGGGKLATHHRLEPLGETDRVVEGRLGRVPRVSRRDGLELVCHQHASFVSLGDAQSCRTSSISAFSSGVAWRSGKLKLGVAVESDDILALLVSAVGRVRRAVVDKTRAGWRMVRVGDTTDMCAGAYACRSLAYILATEVEPDVADTGWHSHGHARQSESRGDNLVPGSIGSAAKTSSVI